MKLFYMLLTALFSFAALNAQAESDSLFESKVLSMKECVDIALRNNYDLILVKNDADKAEISILGSWSGVMPRVDFSAGMGKFEKGDATYLGEVPVKQDSTGNTLYVQRYILQPGYSQNYNNLQLSINWTIFDGMRSYYAVRRSYLDRDAAFMDLQSKINNTVSQVRAAYLDVLKFQKLVDSKAVALERSEEQLRKQRLAFQIGSATRLDTLKAHVSYNTDKVDLINSKNSLKQAIYTLNTILAINPFTQLKVQDIEESKIPKLESFLELKQMVLARNPALKASEIRLKASSVSRKQALSPFIPNINLNYSYSRSHNEFKKVFLEDFDLNWQSRYGIGINWNLFNGFSDKVNYERAKIDEINTAIRNRQTKDNLLKQLAVAYDNLKSAIAVVDINKVNLESAKEDYRLASEKKAVGSATILEVRDAQVNLSRAEQSLIEAYFNALKARAQIDELIGTEYKINDKDGTL